MSMASIKVPGSPALLGPAVRLHVCGVQDCPPHSPASRRETPEQPLLAACPVPIPPSRHLQASIKQEVRLRGPLPPGPEAGLPAKALRRARQRLMARRHQRVGQRKAPAAPVRPRTRCAPRNHHAHLPSGFKQGLPAFACSCDVRIPAAPRHRARLHHVCFCGLFCHPCNLLGCNSRHSGWPLQPQAPHVSVFCCAAFQA